MKNDTKPISDPADKVVEFIEALKNHISGHLETNLVAGSLMSQATQMIEINFTSSELYEDEIPS